VGPSFSAPPLDSERLVFTYHLLERKVIFEFGEKGIPFDLAFDQRQVESPALGK